MQVTSTLGWFAEAPLEPSREQGRQWAADELAKGGYAVAEPRWYEQVVTWVTDRLKDLLNSLLGEGTAVNGPLVLVVLGVLVALAAVAILRFGDVRRTARAHRNESVFEGAVELSAQQHRDQAERAEAAGHYDQAVIEWFRATARGLEERTVLVPRPGRTAHEIAVEATPALGPAADDLARLALLFDEVRYGEATAGTREAQQAKDAEAAVRGSVVTLP